MNEEQIVLDAEQVAIGINRFRTAKQKAREKGRETTVGSTHNLLVRAVAAVERALERCMYPRAGVDPVGRNSKALSALRGVEPGVAAYIACRTVLDSLSSPVGLSRVQVSIGQRIEDEVKLQHFKRSSEHMFMNAARDADKSQDYGYKHTVMQHAILKDESMEWTRWTVGTKMRVGALLVDTIIESTGLVAKDKTFKKTGRKTPWVLKATPETLEAVRLADEKCELMRPWFLPMVVPPLDWTTPFDGGYPDHLSYLVSSKQEIHGDNYQEQLQWADLHIVYSAVNALQRTAYRINPRVQEVVAELWRTKSTLGGLPAQGLEELPPRIPGMDEDKALLKEWKRQARKVYTDNALRTSRTISTAFTVWLANKFVRHRRIYFPHKLDWRGRAYAFCTYLEPQGNDLSKALLEYADPLPIETPEQAQWLAIHGANLWGEDKCNFEDRVRWVNEHKERILTIAEDPFTDLWWTEADKPWGFLAWCFDWKDFMEQGYGYESRMVVAMDGTCNGLQHLSAAILDEVGGEAVNLTPADSPSDLYNVVAQKLLERLKNRPEEDYEIGTQWVESGLIDRKCVKRQVMTTPYGVKFMGMVNQLEEHLHKCAEDKPIPFNERRLSGPCVYLTRHISEAIKDTVGRAVDVMEYLQAVGRASYKSEIPIHWTAPNGLPIVQKYMSRKQLRIQTIIFGEMMRPTVYVDGVAIDGSKQVMGIAPNWTHSMDAAHMMLSIVKCLETHPDMAFSMVHDSYGTHAATAPKLATALRETFVDIYKEDWLAKFNEGMVPSLTERSLKFLLPLPERGDLDIEQVREADFFFA